MAKYQSTNNSTVTIFTDGPPSEDPAIQKGLEASKALDFIVENRKIKRLEAADDVGVNVVLEDGEKVYMGFLVHKPVTTLWASRQNKPQWQRLSREMICGVRQMSKVCTSLATLVHP
jgi:hypothetical protein